MADFDVNKRLKLLITEVFKTSPHKFSSKYNDKGGVKTSQVLRERNGLSNNLLEDILMAYPSINKTWLLTGEGEMLKEETKSDTTSIVSEPAVEYPASSDPLSQLIRNNTILVESNAVMADSVKKLTDQIIKLCSNEPPSGLTETIEAVKREITETIRGELKNNHAREDAKCADVG
ncbi:MAG: hypothetical protein BGO30_08005 [Bacteroidetes bacterium 41-46]|nr:MAG: hypothetical protein BGO30_08005 [Bacteroidetes bacterium 41-46]